MRKSLVGLGLALVLGAGIVGGWFLWRGDTVVLLGEAELEQAIGLGFPVEKTYLGLLHVRLTDPRVVLRENSDRIGLSFAVAVGLEGLGKPARGSADLSCRIRYEPAEGSFYADDPSVDRLRLGSHAEGVVEKATGAVTWIVKGLLVHRPIYTLRSRVLSQSVAKLVLKDVRVENGNLRLTLSAQAGAGRAAGP